MSSMLLVVLFIFVLGIGNFALHRAVLESRHELLSQLPRMLTRKGGRISLGFEFAVLLSAMLLVQNGWQLVAIAYLIYSGANAIIAWLILTKRV